LAKTSPNFFLAQAEIRKGAPYPEPDSFYQSRRMQKAQNKKTKTQSIMTAYPVQVKRPFGRLSDKNKLNGSSFEYSMKM
jgi:hypothetical protein